MPDRDLKLNSLPRHSKESPNLILEEHSHCEVPAGCGGVVLRWLNPSQGVPLQVWLYAASKVEFYLDGLKPSSGRPLVTWGRHVWSAVISEVNPDFALFSFAGFYDPKQTHIKTTGPAQDRIFILSAPESSWKYTSTEPADPAWMATGFDDSSWETAIPKDVNPVALEKTSRDAWRLRKLGELGATPLGVSGRDEKIWLRKEFDLKPEIPTEPK